MTINSVSELIDYIRCDAYRYHGNSCGFSASCKLYILTIGFRYIFWMRVCCYLKSRKILFPLFLLCWIRLNHISHKSGIQIPCTTSIGKGFYIGHFGTMVINSNAILGKNVNISPNVNIGQANRGPRKGVPIIGDEVYIGPGAKIVGRVDVGNNVAIGANAVITKDVPDNACVGGVPARILSMDGAVGYINKKV